MRCQNRRLRATKLKAKQYVFRPAAAEFLPVGAEEHSHVLSSQYKKHRRCLETNVTIQINGWFSNFLHQVPPKNYPALQEPSCGPTLKYSSIECPNVHKKTTTKKRSRGFMCKKIYIFHIIVRNARH